MLLSVDGMHKHAALIATLDRRCGRPWTIVYGDHIYSWLWETNGLFGVYTNDLVYDAAKSRSYWRHPSRPLRPGQVPFDVELGAFLLKIAPLEHAFEALAK